MKFKTQRVAEEWAGNGIDRMERGVVEAFASRALAIHDWEVELTCLKRTPRENDALYGGKGDHLMGVHVVVPCRGADVHTPGTPPAVIGEMVAWVNSVWIYDPSRPEKLVAFYEPEAKDAAGNVLRYEHLHLQVHPCTVTKNSVG